MDTNQFADIKRQSSSDYKKKENISSFIVLLLAENFDTVGQNLFWKLQLCVLSVLDWGQ